MFIDGDIAADPAEEPMTPPAQADESTDAPAEETEAEEVAPAEPAM